MIAPPAPFLSKLSESGSQIIGLGAQDVSAHEDEGAYTGEFSARMLRSAGVNYAIIAHSERRKFHGEDDALANQKIKACLNASIIPVYCCGETLDERESGKHIEVVKSQVKKALENLSESELDSLVVAYEPVWAIGTGKTATSEQAQEMHTEIRNTLSELFSENFAKNIRILYGGSCKPSNAESLFSQEDVDGGLIGGASLNAEDFLAIIRAAK
jgi:triosephosphate isomerase